MRSLLALPCRLGGLNIIDPTQMADWHYQTSERITAPLAAEIVNQQPSYSVDKTEIQKTKKASKSEKETAHKSTLNKLRSNASPSLRRSIELAGEKKVSSWLTIRHNEVRDITADLINEVCSDVAIEPRLNPSQVNAYTIVLPTGTKRHGWMFRQEVYGVVVNAHFSILGCFTPTRKVTRR